MPNPVDEEEDQHLATLDELEETRALISGYQSLLKELPEIFERKFQERCQPVLERNQQLIEEKSHLLLQLNQSFPFLEKSPAFLSSPLPLAAGEAEISPRLRWGRWWWLVGCAVLGIVAGRQLSHQLPPKTQTPQETIPRPRLAARPTPLLDTRSRVVDQAMAEWHFFGRPTIRQEMLVRAGKNETDPGYWQRVVTYWREGAMSSSPPRQEEISSEQYPWSAAFISYVMNKAGAGTRFPYAASHSLYIKAAIANSESGATESEPLAHRPSEYAPRPGDLICSTKHAQAGDVTYENAITYGFFPSRCDVVVSNSDGEIKAIGGDLMDRVALRGLKANEGKLAAVPGQNWLAVIQPALAN
ncbi:MAG: DUF2272 domain-containing protein [Cyanobacteriota bacterium]|jgi:hypothetical protein